MTISEALDEYVLLPERRTRTARVAGGAAFAASPAAAFLRAMPPPGAAPVQLPTGAGIRILDSIREDGPKLVQMSRSAVAQLRAQQPNVRVAPVVNYRPARAPFLFPKAASAGGPGVAAAAVALGPGRVQLKVVAKGTDNPVVGARVVAFTNFAGRFGAGATSDAAGIAILDFGSAPGTIERLYVYPPLAGFWGALEFAVHLSGGSTIELTPIDLTAVDSLRHFLGSGTPTDGAGVSVAVLDTGVGPHPDLVLTGGPSNGGDLDNGEGHGTHVAGIIASRGVLPGGLSGVAPGVTLRSYRVFSNPNGLAQNFTIAKAIERAVENGCDLINLSLSIDPVGNPGGIAIDPVVQFAMEDAREAGVLPVAAAGNDDRTPVNFPARDPMCLAVSALGRRGTFPPGTTQLADFLAPAGNDPDDFIAAFSNVGAEIDLTAPGVGVVSTVPGGYGVMDGTSMACPAAVGMIARLLAKDLGLLQAARDSRRSEGIARLALGAALSLGFPADLEGLGLLR